MKSFEKKEQHAQSTSHYNLRRKKKKKFFEAQFALIEGIVLVCTGPSVLFIPRCTQGVSSPSFCGSFL
jgi:hypothetical protein